MSRYAFPSQQEPTNGQLQNTTTPTTHYHYKTLRRRGSLDELRSYSASPLLSVRGVYARSRPSSPSPPSLNHWPGTAAWGTNTTNGGPGLHRQQPHLGTSFAAFDAREKKGVPPGTPYPRARVLSSASADDVHLGASRFAAGGPPPPAYGDAAFGFGRADAAFGRAQGGQGAAAAGDEEDEVIYMDEARNEIEAEKTALLRDSAALLYFKVERDVGRDTRSLAGSEDEGSTAKDSRAKHSVKFCAMDDVATFRAMSPELFEGAAQGAARSDAQTRADIDNRTVVERHNSGSFFDHSDDEAAEPAKKRPSGWSKTLKMLKRRFSTSSSSRKNAAPAAAAVDADANSVSEYLPQPPAVIAPPQPEKVKASSASLFNVRTGGPTTRAQMSGSRSTRAPSVRSLSTGRKVLIKRPKAPTSTPSPWETSALTSSARAVEGSRIQMRRPPSGSSSEYTDAASRMSWELPEDLQSQFEVYQEALEVVRRQKAERWVYTSAAEEDAAGGPSAGYVQVARRRYY